MNKMNGRMNLTSKRGSALIMIVLMFAMLLVLGTGAGVIAASSSHNSIRETKQEQAYIAARSVALAIKDEITGASDPEALITNLKNNTTLSAGFLDGATYDLDVIDLDTNTTKFTVTATTASAVDTYSFVMNKTTTTVSNPVLSTATAFLRGSKSIYGQNHDGFEGDIYIHDYSAVTVKTNINGSVFINSKKNHDIVFELGSIVGTDDFELPGRKLGLVASGPLDNKGDADPTKIIIKVNVTGDVYVRGDVEFQTNNARVDGNVYATGSISAPVDAITGTPNANISLNDTVNPLSIQLNHYLGMVDYLYESYDEKEIDLVPDWGENLPSTYDEIIEIDKLNQDKTIEVNSTSGYYDVLLTNSKKNDKDMTLTKNIITKGTGKVRFIIEKGDNLQLETGAIITENPTPEVLNNYLVSKGNSNIIVKTSLYAYTYIVGPGNDGLASGSVNFQNTAKSDYHKLYGSVFAAYASFNADSSGKIKYPSGSDGSGGGSGGGTTTTTWNYAGVTAP